jgi:phosphoribosyl-AMP cyclohydrolase / phosphoribosyl-ATP pyrophosphohydrolase
MIIDYSKYENGLVPTIIQDANSRVVLMLGFMNEDAFQKTVEEKKVTFFSRSKNRLWTKGEESGHFLLLKSYAIDCDNDTILMQVTPQGPTCHTGSDTCWNEKNELPFLYHLENIIKQRQIEEQSTSYTASLFKKGINKIAQKVGEEAVEVIIEAKDTNDDLFLNESADLLFHYLILLRAKGKSLEDVIDVLKQRHLTETQRVSDRI